MLNRGFGEHARVFGNVESVTSWLKGFQCSAQACQTRSVPWICSSLYGVRWDDGIDCSNSDRWSNRVRQWLWAGWQKKIEAVINSGKEVLQTKQHLYTQIYWSISRSFGDRLCAWAICMGIRSNNEICLYYPLSSRLCLICYKSRLFPYKSPDLILLMLTV